MKASEVYDGSNGDVTRAYYRELEKIGPVGKVAMNLFRAQKCSFRAKKYRGGIKGVGSYRSMAYDRKAYSMAELCKILHQYGSTLGIRYGWKKDPDVIFGQKASYVLYVDIPTGQVSFHNPSRLEGPDYPGNWDGCRNSCSRILAFCDSLMEAHARLPLEESVHQ